MAGWVDGWRVWFNVAIVITAVIRFARRLQFLITLLLINTKSVPNTRPHTPRCTLTHRDCLIGTGCTQSAVACGRGLWQVESVDWINQSTKMLQILKKLKE